MSIVVAALTGKQIAIFRVRRGGIATRSLALISAQHACLFRGRELERGHFQEILAVATFLTEACFTWTSEGLFVDDCLGRCFRHIVVAPMGLIVQVLVIIVVSCSQDVDVSVAVFLGPVLDVVLITFLLRIILLLRDKSVCIYLTQWLPFDSARLTLTFLEHGAKSFVQSASLEAWGR